MRREHSILLLIRLPAAVTVRASTKILACVDLRSSPGAVEDFILLVSYTISSGKGLQAFRMIVVHSSSGSKGR